MTLEQGPTLSDRTQNGVAVKQITYHTRTPALICNFQINAPSYCHQNRHTRHTPIHVYMYTQVIQTHLIGLLLIRKQISKQDHRDLSVWYSLCQMLFHGLNTTQAQ